MSQPRTVDRLVRCLPLGIVGKDLQRRALTVVPGELQVHSSDPGAGHASGSLKPLALEVALRRRVNAPKYRSEKSASLCHSRAMRFVCTCLASTVIAHLITGLAYTRAYRQSINVSICRWVFSN